MTTCTAPSIWRQIQRENFTQIKPLLDFLELTLDQRKQIVSLPSFVLNLPVRLASKIAKGTLDDPILRQFVPLKDEEDSVEGFSLDPVEDNTFRPSTRFLHKYKARALLLTSSACAMHCRYCFRRHFDYGEAPHFDEEISLIQKDTSLNEIILSGGDPLSLSNGKLDSLLTRLDQIPHLTKIRFHTRFPIGIPERIEKPLLDLLNNRRCKIFFVLHINHPKEIDLEVIEVLSSLQKIGVILLNQAVLLKGVNDCSQTQLELHQKLIDLGILPYYLHQLDKVEGAAHFEVPIQRGLEIIENLRKHLPGYGVPRYVQEIPQRASKTPL